LEIGNELFWIHEHVRAFSAAEVPVIAFLSFVVVAHHTNSFDHISEPILESMRSAFDRGGQLPQHEFGKRRFSVDDAVSNQQRCLHVGEHTKPRGVVNASNATERPSSAARRSGLDRAPPLVPAPNPRSQTVANGREIQDKPAAKPH
jgi:hypothetical protein